MLKDKFEKLNYRPEIDGLRAVAVIAVIANHFNKNFLPFGYLGVDIFFVISGFVITASILRQGRIGLANFLKAFYSRRITRLLPALLFVATITSIFVCIFHPDPQESILTGVASLLGLSNLFLLYQSTDYFAASTELNSFTHTWSLGVEEQFYFLFPIIAYCLLVNPKTRNPVRDFVFLIGALALLSWTLFSHLYPNYQSSAYFLMPARFWELAAGCLTFILITSNHKLLHFVHSAESIIFVLLLAVLACPPGIATPMLRVPLIVILTSMLLLVVKSGSLPFSVLTNKHVVFFGLISYSLYLWHWPILSLSRLTVGINKFTIPIQCALMFALAVFTFRFIETPFRRACYATKNDLMPSVFSAIMIVSGLMLFLGFKGLNRLYIGRLLHKDYPVWIRRPWFSGRNGLGLDNCTGGTQVTSQRIGECLVANVESQTTAYVIGDSHARNYVPAVQALFGAASVRYLTVGSECSFSPPALQKKYRGKIEDCLEYVRFVADYLKNNARYGDVVFVGQRLFIDSDAERQSDVYFRHVANFSQILNRKGIPLVLLDGTRPPSKTPQECFPLPWKPFVAQSSGCYVPREIVESSYEKFDNLARRLQLVESNFFYAPLRVGLCDGDICGQFMTSGTPIWRDMGHITDAASSELWLRLRSELDKQKFRKRFRGVRFKPG